MVNLVQDNRYGFHIEGVWGVVCRRSIQTTPLNLLLPDQGLGVTVDVLHDFPTLLKS